MVKYLISIKIVFLGPLSPAPLERNVLLKKY